MEEGVAASLTGAIPAWEDWAIAVFPLFEIPARRLPCGLLPGKPEQEEHA
jgi:hypothetical protein